MVIFENPSYLLTLILLFINIVLLVVVALYYYNKNKELKRLAEEVGWGKSNTNSRNLEDEITPNPWYVWICSCCICIDILLLGALASHWWAAKYFTEVAEGDSNKALFGDSFGAVNALISAFAFAGVLVAFFLQRTELRLQRKELQLTRDEMNEQTEQFKKQNDTLLRERFETTFFNMLELHQQIVNELSTNQTEEIRRDLWDGDTSFSRDFPVDEKISGRNLFFHAFCNIIHEIPSDRYGDVEKIRGMKGVLEEYGFNYYEEMQTPTYFDHYFRHLYTILSFINKNEQLLNQEEQYQYAKILRATLSRYELVWLYYNGLSDYGNEKLKPLIERYCMLKNLRADLLVCNKENRDVLNSKGKRYKDVQHHFSGTDYEHYLTSEYGDKTKYHISAFYNTPESQEQEKVLIQRWSEYLG